MEGQSPSSSNMNFSNLQESHQLGSLMDEWTNALKGVDRHTEGGEEESAWGRVSWTNKMAKLLITASSYIGEGAFSDANCTGINALLLLPKIGKWKAISMALAERGFKVSPQQCEGKFNDLNKKYKRLQVILGNGVSCRVVENPRLLQVLNLPGKVKEEAYKILTSKQLLYQELCSYHHKNRLFLPHDRELQGQLISIVKGGNDLKPCGDPNDAETNGDPSRVKSAKRTKVKLHPHVSTSNSKGKDALTEGGEGELLGTEQLIARWHRLEEQKLEIHKQKLKLENQRLDWLKICQMEEWKMEEMRLENEALKLQNAHIAFQLKRQELRANDSRYHQILKVEE